MILFHQHLLRYPQISMDDIAFISSFFREEILQEGDYFLRQDNVCAKLAFVTEGVLKTGFTYSDAETIRYFSQKQQWVGHRDSFIGQKPSPNSVRAITNCQLLTVTLPAFQRLEEKLHSWSPLWNSICEELQAAEVNPHKRFTDPKERYEDFIRTKPEQAFALSTEDIAIYLQIPHKKLLQILCETLFFF